MTERHSLLDVARHVHSTASLTSMVVCPGFKRAQNVNTKSAGRSGPVGYELAEDLTGAPGTLP